MRLRNSLLVALLLVLSLPLCAMSVDLGVYYGGAVSYMKGDSTISVTAKNDLFSYQSEVMVDGTVFTESGLGAGFGMGLVIPHIYREYGITFTETMFPVAFKPYLSLRYRYSFMDQLAVEAGAGVYVKGGSVILRGSYYSQFEVGGEVDAALRYTPVSSLALKLGVKGSVPFYSAVNQMDGGRLTQYGITVIPYIAIAGVII